MARTATDDLIRQLKRSSRSSDILVPKIEEFARRPIEISDKVDRAYLNTLVKARSRKRHQGIYSPSMLSSCVRHVYLYKTQEVEKRPIDRIEASSYFLNGNFMHFKWQFAVWKMHRKGILELIKVPEIASPARGAEIFVSNQTGDYGGTIDNLIWLPWEEEVVAVDWKSMNGNSFMYAIEKGPSVKYINQLVGYAMLANENWKELGLPKRIKRVLIIGENKNGPVMNRRSPSPMALHEWVFPLVDYRGAVSDRLKKLRYFERAQEEPPPECHNTKILQFKGCPFAWHCRSEVEAIERKDRKLKAEDKKNNPKIKITGRVDGQEGSKGDRERRSIKRKRATPSNSTK